MLNANLLEGLHLNRHKGDFGVTDMDIFGRIKIFGSGNGSTFFIQDHHPFSDGSALKLDAFLVTTTGEKMVKLMVVTF